MRIAVTHPTCWPEVRRGSERLLHDLSHDLASRGHAVTVISTVPLEKKRRVEQDGPVRRVLLPRRGRSPMPFRGFGFFHRFAWQLRDELTREAGEGRGYDAVHCLNYHDAWGASLARRRGARFRLVCQLTGIPVRRYFRRIPLDGLIFAASLRRADAVLALSGFALRMLHEEYGAAGMLIPSPTDTGAYAAAARQPTPDRPIILFVGDADEPRKGARLLARAFAAIKPSLPECRLAYSGRAGTETRAAILDLLPPEWRGDVVFHGIGKIADLPTLYASASVVVNPALWEALGMVLVEALAAGTPVVGSDHAGIPDIITDDAIGRLFPPFAPGDPPGPAATNVAGLADAILAVLALGNRDETAPACQAHASRFSWDVLGPSYEAALAGHEMSAGPPHPIPSPNAGLPS